MPATYNVVPTVATGDWITAGWVNTYVGGNMAANWPGTAAGDLEYYLSAVEKGKLAKPASRSILQMDGVGTPSWSAAVANGFLSAYTDAGSTFLQWVLKTQIAGLLHTKNKVDFNPGGQSFSGSWADITGATLNLTLAAGVTYTVIVHAVVSGYQATAGRSFYVRAMVDGVADSATNPFFNGGGAVRYESLPYIYYAAGVASGTRTVKLQCQADVDPNVVDRGRLEAFAYVE